MPVTVDVARCDGNGECVKACAFAAIEVHDGKAIVFDNCTDCGACVLACGPGAIWSDLFSKKAAAAILAIDFASRSAIASVVANAARSADAEASWTIVDPIDSAGAADAIVAAVRGNESASTLIVLPHAGAGPAIGARVAAKLGAHLMSGCSDLRVDDAGRVLATRPRFGGVVHVKSRIDKGMTVATVLPRGPQTVSSTPAEQRAVEKTRLVPLPSKPPEVARRIVAIGAGLSANVEAAARIAADLFGASVLDAATLAGLKQPVSPDLYVAIGVEGGTEHNAVFRDARIVAALVESVDAPIAQIADYLMVGDIEEHVKALVTAL